MSCKKLVVGALIAGLSLGANAALIEISEDFTGNTFDSNNFVHEQPPQGNSNLTLQNDAMFLTNRGTFATTRDDLFGTEANPLFISGTLRMLQSDIGFLAFRSTGLPNEFYNNEPNVGISLRVHNFGSGQADVMYNATGNASDGTEYDFSNNYPPGGANFYGGNQPIRIEIEDFGSYANFSLTNLSTRNSFSFTQTGLEDSTRGGRVAFGGGNVSWDDILITQGESSATAVSEPAMASVLGLGLAGMFFTQRRRKLRATDV